MLHASSRHTELVIVETALLTAYLSLLATRNTLMSHCGLHENGMLMRPQTTSQCLSFFSRFVIFHSQGHSHVRSTGQLNDNKNVTAVRSSTAPFVLKHMNEVSLCNLRLPISQGSN